MFTLHHAAADRRPAVMVGGGAGGGAVAVAPGDRPGPPAGSRPSDPRSSDVAAITRDRHSCKYRGGPAGVRRHRPDVAVAGRPDGLPAVSVPTERLGSPTTRGCAGLLPASSRPVIPDAGSDGEQGVRPVTVRTGSGRAGASRTVTGRTSRSAANPPGTPPAGLPDSAAPTTTEAGAAAQHRTGTLGAGATPVAGPSSEQVIAGLKATSSADDLVQLLSPEGELHPHPDYPLDVDADLLKGLYRDMVLVRRFDREGNALQRQGQLSIWVPLLGQEAAQIGAGRAMEPQDMAFPSYREHGIAWCRGVDPTQLLGIFRGTEHCGWDPAATGFHSYTIVIGNQVLNATGYAMGQVMDGVVGRHDPTRPDEATITFFGDGATSQGDVHEAMVFAASFDSPVVFYCQNNQWAISEPVEKQSRVPLFHRARGFGFPGIRVDGNDVLACLAVTRWAMDECRSGNGPVLIEAFTYRMDAHTTSDDPSRYRLADEAQAWKLLDPIERVRAHLARTGQADAEYFDGVDVEADALAARFRAHCVGLQPEGPERLFEKVYAAPTAQVERQKAEYLEYLSSFADGEG